MKERLEAMYHHQLDATNGNGHPDDVKLKKRQQRRSAGASSSWYRKPVVLGTGLALGLLLLVSGVVLAAVFPSVFRGRIGRSMPLLNGSVTFKSWSSPGAPIYMQFWLFNLTNPVEFVAGAKPQLQQVGPFTYAEERKKLNVSFSADRSTLSYRQVTYYHFRRNMSCCWESEKLTMVNLPYIGVSYKMRFSTSSFGKKMIDGIFTGGKRGLTVTQTAGEFLWGYKDLTLATIAPLAKRFAGLDINPFVGLFADKNGTDGGEYSVFTGASELSRLARISSWKGSDRLDYWSSPQANMINGSDGSMFPPFVSRDDRMYLFSSDICRSIYLTYTGDVTLHDAVPLYRFQAPAQMFMNATLNPDNAGFCLDGHCLDSGILNMSGCHPGKPAVMSQPHFYQAAAQYQQAVEGVSPGPEFDTLLDIEPNTGVVMRAAKKLQLNMAIFPVEGFSELANLKQTLIMPLIWLNESACLDAASAARFRSAVLQPKRTVATAQWCLIACGLLLAAASAVAAIVALVALKRSRRGGGQNGASANGAAAAGLDASYGGRNHPLSDKSDATLLATYVDTKSPDADADDDDVEGAAAAAGAGGDAAADPVKAADQSIGAAA